MNSILFIKYIFKITMRRINFLLILIFITTVSSQIFINQTASKPYTTPCIAFQSGRCLTCPFNYHMYQNQCYLNITGCLSYTQNSSGYLICNNCDPSISYFDGQGSCILTVSLQRTSIFIKN